MGDERGTRDDERSVRGADPRERPDADGPSDSSDRHATAIDDHGHAGRIGSGTRGTDDGVCLDPPVAVTLLYGVTLVGLTAYHHLVRETVAIDQLSGPLAAFALDGTLALGVVGVGVWLARSAFDTTDRGTVTLFGVGGSLAFGLAVTGTILIRLAEGRVVSEPTFLLATTLGAGYLAGAVGGVYRARARREAREVARVRDALAFVNGMLRHDVRNDANVIAGYAERVGEPETAATLKERAQTVVDRTEQARAVVEAVAGDAEQTPVDPAELLRPAVDSARRSFGGLTVETALTEGLSVRANESLRPVVDNLLENAVEHHDRDDPVVRVGLECVDDVARITVADDGPGLGPTADRTLFDHDEPGTAAGLNVVDTIVDGLGGEVWAHDREGVPQFDAERASDGGAVFVVDLPLVEAAGADAQTADTDGPSTADDTEDADVFGGSAA
ncbi:ATP-binding protein [Halobaculum sp. MBLA0147]|uniref:ATP-binding protein n=1 Tax=Halobaculum sp. MBLA0147 TaxID=3079934 RepID=UPI00352484B5